jgi:hypothetical protein
MIILVTLITLIERYNTTTPPILEIDFPNFNSTLTTPVMTFLTSGNNSRAQYTELRMFPIMTLGTLITPYYITTRPSRTGHQIPRPDHTHMFTRPVERETEREHHTNTRI